MFLLISHPLNEIQQKQAREIFGVREFVNLPEELQQRWSNVPPELEKIDNYIKDFCIFLADKSEKGDVVLVQGDYGTTYKMVNYCKHIGLFPVYATTKRVAQETIENGKVIIQRVFEHVRFREY